MKISQKFMMFDVGSMNFIEAEKLMREGKKLLCRYHDPEEYFYMDSSSHIIGSNNSIPLMCMNERKDEDAWEVYDDSKFVEGGWGKDSILRFLYTINDKPINLIFSEEIVNDVFEHGYICTGNSEDIEKRNEHREKAKKKVRDTIETKDNKLNYLLKEALKDEDKEYLKGGAAAPFKVVREKHFYSHKDSDGVPIYKDYR